MKVEVKTSFNTIRILINDVLHVALKKDEFVGVQTWIEGTGKWCIEYHLKTTSILTEQDSKEKWEAIIKELEKIEL